MLIPRLPRLMMALALCAASLSTAAPAQDLSLHATEARKDFDFYARGPYRESVPRPETILGYTLGSRETTYWQQERVVRAIADAAKDRVRYIQYGESVEGRPLRVLVISSPENISRLEDIRADAGRLADPRGLSEADTQAIVARMPVIVWLNHTIHGNESTSFESAMQTTYTLAASEDARLLEALRNCVIVLNPGFNPDGHERFAVYHNSVGMNDPNNEAFEHDEPWGVWGRFNHYRFDMNRDKLPVTQPEVRAEIAEYLRWNPHVYVDEHGTVDQYFFPPVALPVNLNTDVALQEKWLQIFGRGNAAAFDRHGWDYFNRRVFDLHYAGYLDSWATLNGAIGMTYETDGGGDRGFAWERDDGTVITLRDGIARHFVAAIATVETASANREARLRDFFAFRKAAVEEGRTGKLRRVVIMPGRDAGRAAQLVANLRRVGIEVGVAREGFSSRAAHAYGGDRAEPRNFTGGVYVVEMSQPQGRLARAFLEPEAVLNPEFVTSEIEKARRNQQRGDATRKEEYGFYDVTAWALPLTYGVEAYWTEDAAPVAVDAIGVVSEPAGGLRPPFAPEGRVTGGRGTQAFLFPMESDGAARLALQLMREGFRLAVATEPLKAGGRQFPRGTIVARTQRNPDGLGARVADLARQTGVEVFAVDSQWADDATVGVGSSEVPSIEKARICIVAGDPVWPTSYGALWYMFERELRYPFTAVDARLLPRADLSRFNVIVLPDGSARLYADVLGKRGTEALKRWVEAGGTLVAMGGAAAFLADKDLEMTSARAVTAEDDESKDEEKDAPAKPGASEQGGEPETQAAERDRGASGTSRKEKAPAAKPATKDEQAASEDVTPLEPTEPIPVPGAIFRASVDPKYFMSFGYEQDSIAVPVFSDFFLKPSKDGANVLTFKGSKTRISGFGWPGNTEALLENTAYLIDEPTGAGHVILFTEDVTFRRLWRSLDRLFLNAVLFGPSL